MARRLVLSLVFLCALQSALTQVFDVTTIYHVGDDYRNTMEAKTVEVHLKTNARGLPINFRDEAVDDKTAGRDFPTCDNNIINRNDSLTWDTDGWEWNMDGNPFLEQDNYFQFGRIPFHIKSLKSAIGVIFEGPYDISIEVFMVICSKKTKFLKMLTEFYLIRFHTTNTYTVKIFYCSNRPGSNMYLIDLDGSSIQAHCDLQHQFDIQQWSYSGYSYNSFVLDFSSNKWKMWRELQKHNKVMDWTPTPFIEANYFTISDHSGRLQTRIFETNVLRPISSKPVISPWFMPKTDRLCVSVVVKDSTDLNITVKNKLQQSYTLELEDKVEEITQKSWKVLHFTGMLPEELKRSSIRLFVTPTWNYNISVQRVSSCASQDYGDVAVLSLEDVAEVYPKLNTAFDVKTVIGSQGNWCSKINPNVTLSSNGGCERDSLFACPPGFTGRQCEEACGRNSYGHDCKGACSIYSQECRGLRLCTPAFGCQCAPGYEGELCHDSCVLEGTYGNDCKQLCGHCKEGRSCDIYTGHCESCAPGYYPPYCKDTYPVIINAPNTVLCTFHLCTVILDQGFQFKGRGNPIMYQVQYRESKNVSNDWKIIKSGRYPDISHEDETPIVTSSAAIEDFENGHFYEVRVVLIADNLNSYQGSDVPFTKFLSRCTIPDTVDYHVTASSNTTSLTIKWDYKNTTAYWCPVLHYQVSRLEQWKWIDKNTTDTSFTLTGLLPGSEAMIKVRAYTVGGVAPYSETVSASTKIDVPGPVLNLSTVHHKYELSEIITWNPPKNIDNEKINYRLTYQCLKRIACPAQCSPANVLEVQVSSTNETLYSLLPLTQYLVTVAAGEGPGTSIEIGTDISVPTEVAELSTVPPVCTNHSVTVFWKPVDVCSDFLEGYIYKLYKADNMTTILKQGSTSKPSASFDHLSAQTDYVVQVFIETLSGFNPNKYLLINISTSATGPEQVRNLTVYKCGRNLIGLHWEKPRKVYGTIKSFTVTYGYNGKNTTETVPPTPCAAWPNLYCHTLENLTSNKKYIVSVSARNTEVSEDGTPTSITAVTKEGIPGVPENLGVVNTTATSFAVSWKYPALANGIIRSFVMSVEETEQYESEKCCQIYPLVETSVKDELANYTVEVSGLHPASTYTVSLSAKTVSFGPSVTLTIYTQPPPMPLKYMPKVTVPTQQQWTWLPQHLVNNHNNSDIYQPLIKGNILLVVLNSTSSDFNTGIEHEQLKAELKKVIQANFYLAAEYTEADVIIGTEEGAKSKWGEIYNPRLTEGQAYSFAAVQISEYCGVYNVDMVFSSMFTVG